MLLDAEGVPVCALDALVASLALVSLGELGSLTRWKSSSDAPESPAAPDLVMTTIVGVVLLVVRSLLFRCALRKRWLERR